MEIASIGNRFENTHVEATLNHPFPALARTSSSASARSKGKGGSDRGPSDRQGDRPQAKGGSDERSLLHREVVAFARGIALELEPVQREVQTILRSLRELVATGTTSRVWDIMLRGIKHEVRDMEVESVGPKPESFWGNL